MQVSVRRTDLLDWSRNQTGCNEALHRKLSSFHWISPRSCFESSFGEAYLPVSRQRSFCYPWSSSPRKHVFSWVWFHRRLPRRIGRLPHRRTKMKNERMHDLITVLNLDIKCDHAQFSWCQIILTDEPQLFLHKSVALSNYANLFQS